MSIRRPLSGVLLGGALLGAGALAVVGGARRSTVPGWSASGSPRPWPAAPPPGIIREPPAHARGSAIEAAVWASAWTAGGGPGRRGRVHGRGRCGGHSRRRGRGARLRCRCPLGAVEAAVVRRPQTAAGDRASGDVCPAARPAALGRRRPVPVSCRWQTLTTRALGDEWLRTTAALTGRLTPAARAALVTRREEALDELERRDPDGFDRWLAAGPVRGSDPADFVRGGPARRGPVARHRRGLSRGRPPTIGAATCEWSPPTWRNW